jgi:hypothetical protein
MNENCRLNLVVCRECGHPGVIVDQFILESTDGPVVYVKIHCIRRHWFVFPAERCTGLISSREQETVTPGRLRYRPIRWRGSIRLEVIRCLVEAPGRGWTRMSTTRPCSTHP